MECVRIVAITGRKTLYNFVRSCFAQGVVVGIQKAVEGIELRNRVVLRGAKNSCLYSNRSSQKNYTVAI